MRASEFAKRLNGMDLDDFPAELQGEAKKSGLVVVIGINRDMVMFYGAIVGAADVFEGGPIHVDADGVLPEVDDVPDDGLSDYYDRKRLSYLIYADWDQHGFPWSFTTAIPHHRFVVGKDGARYCRGIIFDYASIGGKHAGK